MSQLAPFGWEGPAQGTDGGAILQHGVQLLEEGDVAGARAIFRRALVATPDDACAQAYLALATYRGEGLAESADAMARTSLGLAMITLGRFSDAEAILQGALQLSPGHPRAHELLGIALYRMGRIAEANEQFICANTTDTLWSDATPPMTELLLPPLSVGPVAAAAPPMSELLLPPLSPVPPDASDASVNLQPLNELLLAPVPLAQLSQQEMPKTAKPIEMISFDAAYPPAPTNAPPRAAGQFMSLVSGESLDLSANESTDMFDMDTQVSAQPLEELELPPLPQPDAALASTKDDGTPPTASKLFAAKDVHELLRVNERARTRFANNNLGQSDIDDLFGKF
jgi:hypothetical protein